MSIAPLEKKILQLLDPWFNLLFISVNIIINSLGLEQVYKLLLKSKLLILINGYSIQLFYLFFLILPIPLMRRSFSNLFCHVYCWDILINCPLLVLFIFSFSLLTLPLLLFHPILSKVSQVGGAESFWQHFENNGLILLY